MYSTLDDGDKALTDALFYKMGKINRFDIVIIKLDHGVYKNEKLVKRVIALFRTSIEIFSGIFPFVNFLKVSLLYLATFSNGK